MKLIGLMHINCWDKPQPHHLCAGMRKQKEKRLSASTAIFAIFEMQLNCPFPLQYNNSVLLV